MEEGPGNIRADGRPIDPSPVLSVLLEPRSLVITTQDLYTEYLHGISEAVEDHFEPHGLASDKAQIANWTMVKDAGIRKCLEEGGSLSRSTRISLTCRDVEKMMSGTGKLFGVGR